MKLPENKKERMQVFVLIGIGSAAVLFAIGQLMISPFLSSKQKLKEELKKQETVIDKAERELKFAPIIKAEFDSVNAQLDDIISKNVLHPILGSYLVGITETLETQARAFGIKVDGIQEIGVRDPPRTSTKGAAANAFKSYSVQVSAVATFEASWSFIKKLEEMNPYLCVTEIRITGQPDNPEYHRLTLRIEWPIEAEAEKGQDALIDRGAES